MIKKVIQKERISKDISWKRIIKGQIIVYTVNFPYLWHRDEIRVLLVLLGDVGQPGEYEHAHNDHQHEQSEFFVAVFQRVTWNRISDLWTLR